MIQENTPRPDAHTRRPRRTRKVAHRRQPAFHGFFVFPKWKGTAPFNRALAGLLGVLIVTGIMCGCTTVPSNTVTQVSTIDAILAGAYDGQMTCGELLSHGDLGIGTFDRLDGEMILLDGTVYQVKADGKVYAPARDATTPYASVVGFDADATIRVERSVDCQGLKALVDQAVSNMNLFCAVRVRGLFTKMTTRSVPAQQRPYPALTEVTKNQPVFRLDQVSGTLVGFRSPVYAKGITVPGYHMHFISDDRTSGGHVLEFVLAQGTAEVDVCNRFLMILPEGESYFGRIDLGRDRSSDLDKAER